MEDGQDRPDRHPAIRHLLGPLLLCCPHCIRWVGVCMCVHFSQQNTAIFQCVGSRFSKVLDTRENIHFILKQHSEFVFSLNVLLPSWPMLRPLLDCMGITPFQPQSCICSQLTRMRLPRYVGKPPVIPGRPTLLRLCLTT